MKNERARISDEELEQAIGSFRQSVKSWSEWECSRVRVAQERVSGQSNKVRLWGWLAASAAVAACALAVVMLSGHGEHPQQVALVHSVQKIAAKPVKSEMTAAEAGTSNRPQELQDAQSLQAVKREAAAQATDSSAEDSDDALLAGVDNDIEQGTAKALAPMANWMSDSADR